MLHTSDRHLPLRDHAWDPAVALHALHDIVDDAQRQRAADGRWPLHPLDDEGDEPPGGFKGLYLGRAGMLWALWFLQRQGVADLHLDPLADIVQAAADYRAAPDGGAVQPSLQVGESGILLVHWCISRSSEVARLLRGCVESNLKHPSNEPQLGAPGTLVAAWHLWRRTGQPAWRDLVQQGVDALWQAWQHDDAAGCTLWMQDLYGSRVQYLGAGHGFAGNVQALLMAMPLLDDTRRDTLLARCVATLQATARHHDGAVNWPPGLYTPRPGQPALLMQWCHGAPGIVNALADYPRAHSAAMEALLLGAGQAIWQAGPLVKGYGLCHGTAGNGSALLTLYERTADPLWLHRARCFAMHAIGQREQEHQSTGRARHTLWTGGLGLAIFLWQCVHRRAGTPVLDLLD